MAVPADMAAASTVGNMVGQEDMQEEEEVSPVELLVVLSGPPWWLPSRTVPLDTTGMAGNDISAPACGRRMYSQG